MGRLSDNVVTVLIVYAIGSLVEGVFVDILIQALIYPPVYSGFSLAGIPFYWGDISLLSGIV